MASFWCHAHFLTQATPCRSHQTANTENCRYFFGKRVISCHWIEWDIVLARYRFGIASATCEKSFNAEWWNCKASTSIVKMIAKHWNLNFYKTSKNFFKISLQIGVQETNIDWYIFRLIFCYCKNGTANFTLRLKKW